MKGRFWPALVGPSYISTTACHAAAEAKALPVVSCSWFYRDSLGAAEHMCPATTASIEACSNRLGVHGGFEGVW